MNGFNRLVRRKATYYIRARIPDDIRDIAHRNEFIYSLRTNNYYDALEKVRKESYKVDCKINFLRALKIPKLLLKGWISMLWIKRVML